MRKKIEVLKTDIVKGKCQDPERCAVARAMNRAIAINADIRVQDTYATIGEDFVVELPARVIKWIKKFDISKASVKPFSFYLSL